MSVVDRFSSRPAILSPSKPWRRRASTNTNWQEQDACLHTVAVRLRIFLQPHHLSLTIQFIAGPQNPHR
jgi:hypothetical protein